jgi:hypothetical protein
MEMNGKRFVIVPLENRYFALYEGEYLVCITVYKKGAMEVKRRLEEIRNLSVTGGGQDGLLGNQE